MHSAPYPPEPIRLAIIRNFTVETIHVLLDREAGLQGQTIDCHLGDYDQFRQEILAPDSFLYRTPFDVIAVSLVVEHLDPGVRRVGWNSDEISAELVSYFATLVERTPALVVLNTFLAPLFPDDGFRSCLPGRRAHEIGKLNDHLIEFTYAHPSRVVLLDWRNYLMALGEERAFDRRFGYMFRSPFGQDFLERYARDLIRLGRCLRGGQKKCLVLDCDNTLWGGVIGEDGIDGIALDPNEYPGRCYYEFQESVLNLQSQGVIIVLNTKNNPADVWEVLERHPHCLIKRHHLAAWRINWEDKASNLISIARELNIGLDSCVFVDDAPHECELVRDQLPDVTVVELPSPPYLVPEALVRDGWFDRLGGSAEDSFRTDLYAQQRERVEYRARFASLEDYLASLDLVALVREAGENDLPRAAQLVARTNQFNLTNRRHSEARLKELIADPAQGRLFTLAASDRFGDMGTVGVLLALRDPADAVSARIDLMLLSCRAIGRKLELPFIQSCLEHLEATWGIQEWQAEYIPSGKNAQVAGFWQSAGFEVAEEEPGRVRFHARAATRANLNPPFIRLQFCTDGALNLLCKTPIASSRTR